MLWQPRKPIAEKLNLFSLWPNKAEKLIQKKLADVEMKNVHQSPMLVAVALETTTFKFFDHVRKKSISNLPNYRVVNSKIVMNNSNPKNHESDANRFQDNCS